MRVLTPCTFLACALALVWPSLAAAQDAEAACRSLDRPNIDCGCVARRIAVFDRASPTAQARAMLGESYLYALGLENRMDEAVEAHMSDPMSAMTAVEAYDRLGGQPSNIEEFEQGCVIEGASQSPIPEPSSTPAAEHYVNLCSSIASSPRWCACTAARAERHLGEPDGEAFLWGMADVRTVEPEDRERVYAQRGAQMGMTGAEFAVLLQRARDRHQLVEGAHARSCEAMIWADDRPGFDEDARLDAGFEPGVVGQLASDSLSHAGAIDAGGDALANAREIAARNCAATGNSEHYCACYMRDFEARVVQPSSPEVALAWALNFAGEGLGASERMTLAQSLPPSAMQQSATLFTSTTDIGASCTRSAPGSRAEPARQDGSPRDRMIALCTADGADMSTCTCAVDRMEAQFPPADFELIVDIREADARGEEDPLAAVAAERGLGADEARDALENNPAIIRGSMMMGQSMMQCMGGMPTLPAGIPGLPGGGG